MSTNAQLPLCLIALAALAAPAVPPQRAPAPVELLIKNGTVIDGSGAKAFRADIAVDGGRIVGVGRVGNVKAAKVIDASGLIVAPGFIDVHTHADSVAGSPLAENFVRMGVTTVVAGNCGSSPVDVGAALEEVRSVGVSVNFATLIGHNSVRREVMGTERRPPTPAELERMKVIVKRAMAEGAVGLSTGLQYIPGAYAETGEIVELAKVAAAAGGLYASHMRNEGTAIEKAVSETIAVGEAAGCAVQISHLKIDSPKRWGLSPKVLAMIDDARRRGLNVRADQYVYTAGSSSLGIRFPAWVLEGGRERVKERLDDPPTWQKIKDEMAQLLAERGFDDLSWAVVASYAPDPSINGLSVRQVAARWKKSDTADSQLEVARDMMRAGGATMVYHFMSEQDIIKIMRHPHVAVASDSSVLTPGDGAPHPRGYGNSARVLGRYVREMKTLSLEEAIRKMTSLPAAHFRFVDRGLIKTGRAADLVLFDRAKVDDPATYEDPHRFATGIPYVIVNGVTVIREGRQVGARPGQLLSINGRLPRATGK